MQALLVGERLVWVRGGWLPMPGKNTVESPDDLLDDGWPGSVTVGGVIKDQHPCLQASMMSFSFSC